MNLASCPTHPDRKQQMICISDECQNRFELRCVQCVMGSKCRQSHNWKIVTEAIQELFEICQTTQVKEEKKGKQPKPVNEANVEKQKQIQSIVQQFKTKIEQFSKNINLKVDDNAKKLLSKLSSDTDAYMIVKGILKTSKKDTAPEDLSLRFKEISNYIKCGPDGLIQFQQVGQGDQLQDTDFSAFQGQLDHLIQNLFFIVDEQNQVPSQVEQLKKGYESQIDKLLDQVKQIPVLQNRIESLNEKLQVKDAKLKKYEAGGNMNASVNRTAQQLNKKQNENDDSQKIKRIQTLIDRRQKLRTSLIQYCQKSPQQELYLYQLKPTQNISKLQIPVATNTSYILNECVLGVADELQFLKYSDATSGEAFIEIPLISMKKQRQPQQGQQSRVGNGGSKKFGSGKNFLDSLFGL